MNFLPTLSFAATLLLTGGLGITLLRVAMRTREFPEAAIGTAAVCLSLAALVDASPALVDGMRASTVTPYSHLLYGLGAITISLVLVRLFRPRSGPARLLSGALSGIEAVACVLLLAGPAYVQDDGTLDTAYTAGVYMVSLGVRLLIYGWLAAEALIYFLEQRRGLRFGLSEPLIVQQFLGWAISAACMAAGVLGAIVQRLATGEAVTGSRLGLLFFSALALTSALMLWLSFLPPRWYVERLERAAREPAP